MKLVPPPDLHPFRQSPDLNICVCVLFLLLKLMAQSAVSNKFTPLRRNNYINKTLRAVLCNGRYLIT